MKNEKILQLLEENKIETLKELLKKELLEKELKKSNRGNRNKAVKRFFKFEHNNLIFNNFTEKNGYYYMADGCCAVKTTEQPIMLENKIDYDEFRGKDMEPLYDTSITKKYENIDIKKVLIDAKINGYRYAKKETTANASYYFKFKDTYFKIGLLDKAFSVIDNNKPVTLYYRGKRSALMIANEIGQVLIMPMRKVPVNRKVFAIE